ncbi:hypothetical protein AB0K52_05385 [Glycomyces sp. NPDC049804]|uniref:hypothetical protein n=1 Tax=Glycomyces sp. NPDC049804 TaxID=3154363 RepID=UPI0034430ACC
MEYETPDSPRIDPPMTVESGGSRVLAEESHQARSIVCRHRLRWRELSFTSKFRTALYLVCSVAALAVAIGCLVDGGMALRAGLDSGDDPLILRGGVEVALFVPLVAGPLAYLRLWRFPHRPARSATAVHACAVLMLILLLSLSAGGREWLVLLAFPAAMVAIELRWLRRILTERSTCSTEPGRPMPLRMLTAEGTRWPVTDEQRMWVFGPRVVEPGFDSWRCAHAIFWDDLRTKAKLEWVGWAIAEPLYWAGLMLTFAAVFLHQDRLLAASPIGLHSSAPLIAAGLLAYQVQLAKRALRGRPLFHRTATAVYVHGAVGNVLIAALAAGIALELDRPYFWAVTALALYQAYSVIDLLMLETPWSSCAARPELHRRVRASLRPGRGGAPF